MSAGQTEPTRIALFASSFHPHPGGVEELVRQLAHAQQRAGLDPVVYTMRWPKSLPAREDVEGTPVLRFVFRSPGLPVRRLVAALVLGPVTLVQFVLELRRQRCQVLHIECVSPAGWYALQATRLLRLPLVVTMQGELTMDATGLYQRSWWARRTLRLLLRRADAITACSAHTLHEAEDWYGSPFGPRASVIHNGVDVTDFEVAAPHATDQPYVLAIGRHVRQKGFDLLLDAFASLVARPDFAHRLVVAGDGPERGALKQQAIDLGIAERVDFPGATDRAATASLFRGADVFVLPSRHEPFGIVVLEALAAGAPTVAADVGGVGEFLPDTPLTRLVAPDQPAALAAGIDAILSVDDRDLHREPAVADTLAAHSWTALERAYARCYAWAGDAPFDAQERWQLCDLFAELGPDAPTLLEGWTAHDLAAHLVLRERDLVAGPCIALPGPFSRFAERRRAALAERRDFAWLVTRIRSGPPIGFFRIGWVRSLPNLNEFFVHHEDLRRANGRGVRALTPALDTALWRNVRRSSRHLTRRLGGVGLEVEWPGGGEQVRVRPGEPRARLSGPPGELLLYVFGRQSVAQVELGGSPEAVKAVRQAHLGM